MPKMDIDGTTLNYVTHGSGEPVVLIHSSSSSLGQWRRLWELLQGGYLVMATDMLGYGGTDLWSGEADQLLTQEAKIIHAATADFEDGFHLVGHSYGGLVALRVALENPGRIKSLVLIEPMVSWLLDNETDADAHREILSVAQNFWRSVDDGDHLGAAKPYMEYWAGEGSWQEFDEKLREYVVATAVKSYDEFTCIFNPATQIAPLETITAPSLVIRGGDTRTPARRACEIMVEKLPDARLEIIDGGGHLSPITHPDAVNTVIHDFLTGLK